MWEQAFLDHYYARHFHSCKGLGFLCPKCNNTNLPSRPFYSCGAGEESPMQYTNLLQTICSYGAEKREPLESLALVRRLLMWAERTLTYYTHLSHVCRIIGFLCAKCNDTNSRPMLMYVEAGEKNS
ncbi:hypothetical protein AVEN_129198-1 [Araneus ventricosus]|uniref:Uncharacterized protein n=1 Tax=Araneus ventricosus TaxID=182803 RepID=A0A4Y2H992_ARAVE|nr:hypothetical protein AVEN_129198-1 [Araneus ventricosus]